MYVCVYLWLCWALIAARAFPSCRERGCSPMVARWPLLLQSTGSRQWRQHVGSVVAPELKSTGSVLVVDGLGGSTSHGIFLDQGSNPCLLHWQTDSLPLSHQTYVCAKSHISRTLGSPALSFLTKNQVCDPIKVSRTVTSNSLRYHGL